MIDRNLNYGREHIRQFLARAQPFHTVLDLGAGVGADLLLAEKVNPKAVRYAVEVHAPNVEKLRQLVSRVIQVDIERDTLPFQRGEIDIVIANQVLEHMKEIFWICHEVSRILPVNGKFIVGVPNLAALHNRILLLLGRQPSPVKTASAHVRGFTKQDFLHFLNTCFPGGYRVVAFAGSNFYPFPPGIAQILSRIFPNLSWGIFFLLEKVRDYEDEFLKYPVDQQLETNFFVG